MALGSRHRCRHPASRPTSREPSPAGPERAPNSASAPVDRRPTGDPAGERSGCGHEVPHWYRSLAALGCPALTAGVEGASRRYAMGQARSLTPVLPTGMGSCGRTGGKESPWTRAAFHRVPPSRHGVAGRARLRPARPEGSRTAEVPRPVPRRTRTKSGGGPPVADVPVTGGLVRSAAELRRASCVSSGGAASPGRRAQP